MSLLPGVNIWEDLLPGLYDVWYMRIDVEHVFVAKHPV